MVRERGLEPPRLATLVPETSASTIPPHPHAGNRTGVILPEIILKLKHGVWKNAPDSQRSWYSTSTQPRYSRPFITPSPDTARVGVERIRNEKLPGYPGSFELAASVFRTNRRLLATSCELGAPGFLAGSRVPLRSLSSPPPLWRGSLGWGWVWAGSVVRDRNASR